MSEMIWVYITNEAGRLSEAAVGEGEGEGGEKEEEKEDEKDPVTKEAE